ncbi:hypothetical protein Efla_002883 [Eimeria flavescens]
MAQATLTLTGPFAERSRTRARDINLPSKPDTHMAQALPIVPSQGHAAGLRVLYNVLPALANLRGERSRRASPCTARRATGNCLVSRTPIYDGAGLIRRRSVAIPIQRRMTWIFSGSDSCEAYLMRQSRGYGDQVLYKSHVVSLPPKKEEKNPMRN